VLTISVEIGPSNINYFTEIVKLIKA
jgi:hypothetical protein